MPSEIGLSSLVWSTDSKILLQESLNFSSASKCILQNGKIPSNYTLLLPDKQLKSQSPETVHDDGSVYDESSTASSSPLSYTKELTNVSSPLTPLSDARRSKSKSPSHLTLQGQGKFLVDDDLEESANKLEIIVTPDDVATAKQTDSNQKQSKTTPSTSKEFIGPVRPDVPSVNGQSPKKLNGSLEKKQPFSSIFPPNSLKPKTMTIKIGKETMATKELMSVRPAVSNSLVPYGGESSDDDADCNNDKTQVTKTSNPIKERAPSPHTIIGPLKPSIVPLVEPKLPLMSKRLQDSVTSPPALKRKRLLSERGEKEMAYPVMDKSTISAWNWNGCQNIVGRNRGCGLYNNSNDCFLNAILQVITHTAPLCRYLLERHQNESCSRGNSNCVACALRVNHLRRSLSNCATFHTNWIRSHLRRIFPSHIHGMQEDAHELLALMLDAIDPPVANSKNGNVINGVNTKPSTPIEQIFGGTLRNQVACDICKTIYTNYERIRELNLAIKPDADHTRISFLIDNYFKDEIVSSFDCKKCARKTAATRKTKVLRPPAVLLVQLKRFNAFGQKIRLPVTPEIDIDLAKYLSEAAPTSCTEYVLTSVVEHLGTAVDHGHYIAYCRGFDHKQWFLFDDDSVTGVIGQKVTASNPYLLVYSRRDDMPFHPAKKSDSGIYKVHTSYTQAKTNGFSTKVNGYNGNFNRYSKTSFINGI